ncbi:hypothetical protein NDU88_012559 [Pleurodeles waltl]|uniref:Uncharacterized protein n=1 Tax=Pleurodeles waltl TaxID=8319 RepID=A0AAV7R119_PLEWA|nr:hypothetical protein NDU88_012559 [Pleurodeles waltl]
MVRDSALLPRAGQASQKPKPRSATMETRAACPGQRPPAPVQGRPGAHSPAREPMEGRSEHPSIPAGLRSLGKCVCCWDPGRVQWGTDSCPKRLVQEHARKVPPPPHQRRMPPHSPPYLESQGVCVTPTLVPPLASPEGSLRTIWLSVACLSSLCAGVFVSGARSLRVK